MVKPRKFITFSKLIEFKKRKEELRRIVNSREKESLRRGFQFFYKNSSEKKFLRKYEEREGYVLQQALRGRFSRYESAWEAINQLKDITDWFDRFLDELINNKSFGIALRNTETVINLQDTQTSTRDQHRAVKDLHDAFIRTFESQKIKLE